MLPLRRPAIGRPTFLRTRIGPRVVVLGTTVGATGLARRILRILPLLLLPVRLPVAGRGADFELVELVPLFIGAVPFRDGSELSDPTTRIKGFWIIHADIMNYTAVLIQYSRKMKRVNNPKTVDYASLSAL